MLENPRMRTTVPVSVAPMMDWTDRHCRYFLRLLSPSAMLYTEMITAAAIRHGDRDRLLGFNAAEHPIAVQLGGSDQALMAEAAQAAAEFGYDEININVGCPSDRVQSGRFGACLMAEPELVAECFRAMQASQEAPVTVKTRIGIDKQDSDAFLRRFIDTLAGAGAGAGCGKFVIHARIAVLDGLSPKENRTVPPLNYERVFAVKRDYPELTIVLNGGVETLPQVKDALRRVDGVMIGRQAYRHPYFLAELEKHFRPEWTLPDRRGIVENMVPYIENELAGGEPLHRITRHMLGLFAGKPGARAWRRHISENAHHRWAGAQVLLEALDSVPMAA